MVWLQVCESASKVALVLEQVGGGAEEEGVAALRTTSGDIMAAARHIKLDRLIRFELIIFLSFIGALHTSSFVIFYL